MNSPPGEMVYLVALTVKAQMISLASVSISAMLRCWEISKSHPWPAYPVGEVDAAGVHVVVVVAVVVEEGDAIVAVVADESDRPTCGHVLESTPADSQEAWYEPSSNYPCWARVRLRGSPGGSRAF